MDETQAKIYIEFEDLYDDIIAEFDERGGEYWQGKKDGIRLGRIYVLEALGMDRQASSARALRESSPAARGTTLSKLRAIARSARFYIGEALYNDRTGQRLHPLSRVNWQQWIDWYGRLEKEGIADEADGAI